MKRIALILAPLLIVPNIVLASWWNPLSWKVFHNKIDQKTIELEQKITDLEKKLNNSVSSTPALQENKTKSPSIPPITSIYLSSTSPTTNTETSLVSYNDLLSKYSDFRRQVGQEYSEAISVDYKRYLAGLFKDLTEDINYLNENKNKPLELPSISSKYIVKLSQLIVNLTREKREIGAEIKSSQDQIIKNQVSQYFKNTKYSLYQSSYHIEAARLLDLYDRAYGTDYSSKFKNTKTQVETVEFANSLLLDFGEE